MCEGVDPYRLHIGVDTTSEVDLLPATTHVDTINYLVLSTSSVSLQQMKAYKSLEAHNYFTSGWVRSLTSKQLPSKRIVVLGEVDHSQRLRESPLKAWILANSDGSIITAHCNCMAGAGEACSHVGAMLFAVETAVRLRDSRTCTEKSNAWLPAQRLTTAFKRLRDIDFSSSKMKKKNVERIHLANLHPTVKKKKKKTDDCPPRVPPPAPTENELEEFYSRIADSGARPVIFMVHPVCSELLEPPRIKEPRLLRGLQCEKARSEDMEALLLRANSFLCELVITEDMAEHVEATTRLQSRCPKWYAYRAGRITASVMKSVCSTSITRPSMSLANYTFHVDPYIGKLSCVFNF
ncbi:uncharacterized protein LOC135392355 [Ornithodoros turicata]|uniref:uncharacterized protein LOC135392355 n=1 Tax=Ornithodoros turicata TaxID=34597 RepID=UPI003139953C